MLYCVQSRFLQIVAGLLLIWLTCMYSSGQKVRMRSIDLRIGMTVAEFESEIDATYVNPRIVTNNICIDVYRGSKISPQLVKVTFVKGAASEWVVSKWEWDSGQYGSWVPLKSGWW